MHLIGFLGPLAGFAGRQLAVEPVRVVAFALGSIRFPSQGQLLMYLFVQKVFPVIKHVSWARAAVSTTCERSSADDLITAITSPQ
mmetsp:Transcript_39298/g.104144  ORF Transcript_39298/g.104144 Transcript_39298/m.104144 type:complete len:85 (-) Transcript_39298:451-705(-)